MKSPEHQGFQGALLLDVPWQGDNEHQMMGAPCSNAIGVLRPMLIPQAMLWMFKNSCGEVASWDSY